MYGWLTRRHWVALSVGLTLAIPAPGQDFENVQIETVPISAGIYMLIGQGGNIGVSAGADGVLLIDDQYAPLVDKINRAIAEFTDQPVKMVLNTHWHGDHTGGNELYGEAGALIVAHDNVRLRMTSAQFSSFFNRETPPSPAAALPVVTFDSSVTFHLNGQTIHVEHVPLAHTDGDAIIWFREANVVHLGDTYFNGLYPYIDGERGGSIAGMIAAADHVLESIDEKTRVIPGHGQLSDRAGLADFRNMLDTVTTRIQRMIDDGQDIDQIVAAKPTADFDARFGQGLFKPDDWVRLVHTVMTR
jgi:glyoxylase-like metal-dependent hydrolase (beta-lactamase superfamily II)